MKKKKLPHDEPHKPGHAARLNWLRAAVLGADDGIVSVAGLVIGVAGATSHTGVILAAGLAGIIAGTISMAAGEYVSVSSQKDSEQALLHKEKSELSQFPKEELKELTDLYQAKGLKRATAEQVAKELTAHDAFAAHVEVELGIDPHNLSNPWHAALASAASFLAGAIIPLGAILLPPQSLRIPIAFFSVVIALALTGILSAKLGKASIFKATIRVVSGGVLAMAVTYFIGRMFGVKGV